MLYVYFAKAFIEVEYELDLMFICILSTNHQDHLGYAMNCTVLTVC